MESGKGEVPDTRCEKMCIIHGKEFAVTDIPTMAVQFDCWHCRKRKVKHVHFLSQDPHCERCGREMDVTFLPRGVACVTCEQQVAYA